jgi:DNA-binding LytR/AlgR family response regulator
VAQLKAVLAEDEGNLRDQLRETLAAVWPELEVCAEAVDGIEALRALEQHAPDVLFLDIQMPGMNGLEVAKQASGRCHIVFVTAYDKYAVSAFEQGAIDYVMKPFTAARLADTVRRLRERSHTAPANLEGLLQSLAGRLEGGRKPYLRWITASVGTETRLITMEEILYFQSDNKYTAVMTADREALIRTPIRELAEQLDPEVFWQIHRGTVVNANFVAGIVRNFRGQLEVRLKGRPETLPVSDSFAHRFRQM